MKVKVIAVSKKDNAHIAALHEMYANRIKHYCKFEFVRVKPVKLKANQKTDDVKMLESRLIEKHLSNYAQWIALDEYGREFTSVKLANTMEQWQVAGIRELNFIVGGAYGLHSMILAKAHYKMSLSRMTLPHGLARVMLLEQIYRAMTIIKNEKYHNT